MVLFRGAVERARSGGAGGAGLELDLTSERWGGGCSYILFVRGLRPAGRGG